MKYLYLLCYILIFIGVVLLFMCILLDRKKTIKLKKHKNNKYAILIPARYESRVIEKLLKSIKIQNNDMSNVYVIVEDEKDKTCDITKNYGGNIYVREKPIKSRKGYALDECIKNILKTKHYDLYFIFDADNILDKDFIKNMLESWNQGYDITIGYRNISNPVNIVSGCSILLFSLLNLLLNKKKVRNNKPVVLSGTGFYISGEIVEDLGGFPFNSLTEDYELSLFMSSNNILSTYNEKAIYYDEQPTKMSVSIKQRTRWVKGFFEARKKRKNNLKGDLITKFGVMPLIVILSGIILLIIITTIDLVINSNNIISYLILLIIPLIIYLVLFFITLILIIESKNNLNLDSKLKIKCLFFNPIFLVTFVHCFFKSILSKNVGWDIIKHEGVTKI